ncbi:hypothetical protein CMQ_7838 [Grosmannia clavigera kw1407]|uniref:Uncharacterized protein n=1 Tax=Grosmannia clavigera (strain kw1407 / UAMH 11150) TaxID=655863 RepID=F0XRY3_GROCL|nr:uncharacterized protein CMQ_7838 [Grosmannia clavigera kw1407]EFW99470.1 hypothetical protein CMQ_7838 [Grosmannia clavigera kw1407]
MGPKRSRGFQNTNKPAKKAHVESEHDATDTEDWRTLVLSSEKLKNILKYDPTISDDNAEDNFLYKALSSLHTYSNWVRTKMPDSEDFVWPTGAIEALDDGEKMPLVKLGLALLEIGFDLSIVSMEEMAQPAQELVRDLYPKKERSQSHEGHPDDDSITRTAFECDEIADSTGIAPSRRLRRALMQYMDIYYGTEDEADKTKGVGYHSPYTSIVGPSGSGKTSSVKHLAEDEGVWVAYTSLSRSDLSIPRAGPIGDFLQHWHDEKTARSFWDRYIRACILLVEVAKEQDISPGMLFRLQYHEDFAAFRNEFANLVGRWMNKPCNKAAISQLVNKIPYINDLRKWEAFRMASRRQPDPSWSEAGKHLENNRLILCVDEARGLLKVPADDRRTTVADTGRPVAFRQLRHALSRAAKGVKGLPIYHLFGVFLDTSSRVQKFSPALEHDPSIKVGVGFELFPPLYGINNTWDGMAVQSRAIQAWLKTIIVSDGAGGVPPSSTTSIVAGPENTPEWYRFFYSLGRPQWGAVINASVGVDGNDGNDIDDAIDLGAGIEAVRALVRTKLYAKKEMSVTERDQYHLALLIFRMQFYLSDHKLSEACVADWLHYVRSISADRTTIQTVQPGEPVLAQYVATRMKSPELREEMIISLTKSLHYGALHVGDSGEIVAGLLLLLASDATPADEDNPRFLHRSLASFMHAFVGWLPEDMPPSVATSRVYVTHLGRLCTKASRITQRHLQVAFLTGEAWFLSVGFAGVNLLVPVWQGPGKPMTAVLVQVKNRKEPANMTGGIRAEARTSVCDGRRRIDALNDASLPVYGLFVNLRPLELSGKDANPSSSDKQESALDHQPADGNTSVFIKLGFANNSYPYLTLREYNALHGIVRSHFTGISEDDPHNIKSMLFTRDGSTFLSDKQGEE